jgi:hypothetical protein
VKRLALPIAALFVGASFLTGCNGANEVSSQDAANFSKTPDGKDDGSAAVNNDR